MSQKLPTVSIVIPAYNEADTIERCVESCLKQTSKPFEVIIVNNLSTDDTAKIVRRIKRQYTGSVSIRLLQQSDRQGIVPTRDAGFNAAKGDVIGRIDADSILDPKWVSAVRKTFKDPSVDAATGPVVYHDMPAQRVGFKADEQIRGALDKLARGHKFLFGSNMAIRRSTWQQIEPEVCHDHEDEMHEDIDLALHLYLRGMKVVYDSCMVGGMSARRLEDSPKRFYNYVMRFERTYKRHHIKSATARIPIFIYLTTYFPLKAVRLAYDADEQRFSLAKLRERARLKRDDEDLVI